MSGDRGRRIRCVTRTGPNEREGRDEMKPTATARASGALARSVIAGAALAAVAAMPAPAMAQDVITNVLGAIGIVDRERPNIDYRERPPLVVPPSLSALPPPVEIDPETAPAPNWPQDPDLAAARARALEAATPAEFRQDALSRRGRALTPDELALGRIPGAGIPGTPGPREFGAPDRGLGGANANPDWVPPDALRRNDEIARELAGPTRLERRFLTDPPAAYLQPDPNAAMPEAQRRLTTRQEPPTAQEFIREEANRR